MVITRDFVLDNSFQLPLVEQENTKNGLKRNRLIYRATYYYSSA